MACNLDNLHCFPLSNYIFNPFIRQSKTLRLRISRYRLATEHVMEKEQRTSVPLVLYTKVTLGCLPKWSPGIPVTHT